MEDAPKERWLMAQEDQRITEAIDREYSRLRNFIRRRVADQFDPEDILQDVFYEVVGNTTAPKGKAQPKSPTA